MKIYYKSIFTMAVLLLFSIVVIGQQRQVKGRVKDKSGTPLTGVSISTNSRSLASSKSDGTFDLNLQVGNSLTFTLLGYESVITTVPASGSLEVTMMSKDENLDEVVVYGYGKVQKKDLTGSIANIQNSELVQAQATNVTEALNGRVSGVLVTKTNNRPGADMSVQIRGTNSFNYSNEPLYVIDGIPSYSGMRHLNAADIESIDILKDASSSAIYGSRGANGVVIITTKAAGKKQGFQLEYAGSLNLKTPTRIPDMIGNMGNGLEYVNYKIALWKKKYGESSLGRSDFLTTDEKRRIKYGEYYDWLREVTSNSLGNTQYLSANGQSEKSNYAFSAGYNNDEGLVGSENFKRYTVNMGLQHRISERFKVGMNNYFSFNRTNHGADDALINAYFIPPIASPYDKDGNYAFEVQPTSSKINPFVQIENNKKVTEANFINLAGFTEFKPLQELTFKSQFAIQLDNDTYGEWIGRYTQAKSGVNAPDAFRRESKNLNYVWDNTLTYDKNWADIHKINVVGLFSMQKETHQGSQMRGVGMPFDSDWHAIQSADEITDVSSYYWEAAMLSYMMRFNYGYKDRYLLTLTGRRDGTSRLAPQNRWGFMPSAAIAWRISNEEFMKRQHLFNDLKLRLSWGKSGNNNMDYNVVNSVLDLSKYVINGKGQNGYGIGGTKGNPALTWEMTSEWNLGLDFALLNNRLSGTIDIYDRTTKDLIFRQSVAGLNGFTSILRNVGTTGNRGIELNLKSINVQHGNFSWKTNAVFSLNRNRIKDIFGDGKDDLANRWFIGQPIRVIYDFERLGIWQEEEKDMATKYGQAPGHIKVADLNGDGVLDERDYKVLGTPSPDYTFGLTNTFSYKNFDLTAYVYGRIGGLYNDDFTYTFTAWDNEHWNKLNVAYWTPENRSNSYPQIGAQSYYTQVLGKVSGTFVKVQNITLGYTLPAALAKRLKSKSFRAYASVINPFTFTKYLGPDPEIIGENLYTQLSIYPRIFNVGVNVSF